MRRIKWGKFFLFGLLGLIFLPLNAQSEGAILANISDDFIIQVDATMPFSEMYSFNISDFNLDRATAEKMFREAGDELIQFSVDPQGEWVTAKLDLTKSEMQGWSIVDLNQWFFEVVAQRFARNH
jgi:hypothetical protein